MLVITYLRGIGLSTDLDPQLPVDVQISKSKVFAFNAIDYTTANMLRDDDIGHQIVEDVGSQKIGARRTKQAHVSQLGYELIDRTGDSN